MIRDVNEHFCLYTGASFLTSRGIEKKYEIRKLTGTNYENETLLDGFLAFNMRYCTLILKPLRTISEDHAKLLMRGTAMGRHKKRNETALQCLERFNWFAYKNNMMVSHADLLRRLGYAVSIPDGRYCSQEYANSCVRYQPHGDHFQPKTDKKQA